MQRQGSYEYPYTGATSPKYSSTHSTSSAFSASANPNEDWTKISDLAERRRIQNRIAQRNYRKKIKRRLEDLERRAGSSSASPEQTHAVLVPQAPLKRKGEEGVKRQKSRSDRPATNRKPSPETSSTTCASAKENRTGNYYRQYARDLSRSPPAFSYSSCPLPEPTPQAPYPQHAPFNAVSGHFTDFPAQSLYLPPLPVTLPSMSSFDPAYVKSESVFCDDDMFGQFNLGYSPLTGMDIPSGQMYQESNVHTPPLSHSHSFEYSRAGSPATVFPGTPVSIPDSPRLVIR